MRARKVAALAAATLGVVLGSATAASAATTYVSPGGSGITCLPASPCSLLMALTTAAGNDIVLAPGDYELSTLTGAITPASITGAAGQPRPRITLGTGVALPPVTGAVRHIEIASVNTPLSIGTATLEDAIVTSGAATAVSMGGGVGGVIRNTVVRALAPNATGVDAQAAPFGGVPARLRNATVVATGAGSTAVRAVGFAILLPGCIPFSAAADLLNVIARGAGNDLVAQDGVCGAPSAGTITATTSNFDPAHSILSASSLVNGRGNQSALPLFVDQAAGDLREAAGSPTIDAGSVPGVPSDIGTLDLAGVARILGSLPDIGAFELVPAAAPPPGGGGAIPGGGAPGPTDAAPTVKLLKAKGLRLRTLLKGGWKLRAWCSEACTLALNVTPASGRQRVLARGAARTAKAGTTTLRLKVTKAGRRALKAKRSIRLRVSVVARDSAGQRATAQRMVTVRR